MEKIFACISLNLKDGIFRANLKRDTEKSIELREKYEKITHTDFKTPLWNLVALENDVPGKLITELIQHSTNETKKTAEKQAQRIIWVVEKFENYAYSCYCRSENNWSKDRLKLIIEQITKANSRKNVINETKMKPKLSQYFLIMLVLM